MRILFLAACSQRLNLYSNASVRYRCYNPAEDLVNLGLQADVCHVADFSEKYVSAYDAFIFHRPVYDRFFKKAVKALKKRNRVMIADYDDLLFGEENAVYSPMYINKPSSRTIALAANASYTKGIGFFDYITVSTQPLVEQVLKIKPDAECFVVHNGINQRWFDIASTAKRKSQKVIGYMAGGACHNKDFAEISTAVCDVLDMSPAAELSIPESLTIPRLLLGKKLRVFAKKHFLQLPEVIAQSSVTIAPLLTNEFNRCKSAIKFLESAAVGIPLVATKIPDFERFVSSGLSFAHHPSEWRNLISNYLERAPNARMSSELREYVFSEGMSFQQSKRLVEFLEFVLSK